MSIHTSQVFEYLDAHPVCCYEGNFASLLEMLHHVYTTSNPVDSEEIHAEFQRLEHILKKLPLADRNAVFRTVSDLCFEYELHAFSHGLVVGMHLMTELNALP